MQGLPPNLEFDSFYTMSTQGLTGGHYAFDGYATTKIYFDQTNNLWRMELLSSKNIIATAHTSFGKYPYGTHMWHIPPTNDEEGYSFFLNLNGCDIYDEFNCYDGSCVSIDKR